MFGLVLLAALGAVAVLLTLALLFVVRRRRGLRAPTTFALGDVIQPSATTYWGGGDWPTIIVRSHGRLRNETSSSRAMEVVPSPVKSPWEPPRAS
jgi:hypothetical protein